MKKIEVEVRYCIIEKATNRILVTERDEARAKRIASKDKQFTTRAVRITKIIEFID